MRWVLLPLIALHGMALAQGNTPRGFWERLQGGPEVTAISGNRGLTAGVDAFGRLTALRWPGPGYHDQLESRRTVPSRGAFWAIRVADTLYRLNAPPWGQKQYYETDRSTVVVTEGESDSGIRAEQSLFVHAARDILAARIRVTGLEAAPELFWYQNLSPCTRKLPGLPIADWLLDGANDFALYYDRKDQTFYHFRPDKADRADWERARYLAGRPDAPWAWRVFGSGVWAALGSEQPVDDFDCLTGLVAEKNETVLTGRTSATAPCRLVAKLRPRPLREGAYEAVVFLAFGASHEAARDVLALAREEGFDGLRQATGAYWRAWLQPAGLTLEDHPDESLRRRALLTLAQSTDRDTGAVVQAPVTAPPLALATPRVAAWASLLYDVAGYTAEAGTALRFFGDRVRPEETDGAPRGSMPAALYTDGTPAAPETVVDVDGAGWWLSACLRHGETLDEARRRAFINTTWPGASRSADLLAGWVLMPEGEPYPSYQPDRLRDGRSVGTLFLARLGLESATRLAEFHGDPVPPAWRDTLAEFDARIRFRAINQGEGSGDAWTLPPLLPAWLNGLLSGQDRTWDARVKREDEVVSMREAADMEGLMRPDAGKTPTTMGAALQYLVATARIYGHGKPASIPRQ